MEAFNGNMQEYRDQLKGDHPKSIQGLDGLHHGFKDLL